MQTESIITNLHEDEIVIWKINPKDAGALYNYMGKTKSDENSVFTKSEILGVPLDITSHKSHAVGWLGFYNVVEQF